MKLVRNLAVLAVVVTASPTHAQRWGADTGQGVTEAGISANGARLSVTCVLDAAIGQNRLSLTLNGVPVEGPVTFQPGRRAPVTVPFVQGTYVASDAETLAPMVTLLDGLRRSNSATATTALGQVQIPLSGSSAALAPCPATVNDVANLGAAAPAAPVSPTPAPAAPAPETADVPANPIIAVEEALAQLGYFPGTMDGQIDETLHVAIATWQRDTGREVTGALMLEDFQALLADAAQN